MLKKIIIFFTGVVVLTNSDRADKVRYKTMKEWLETASEF